MATAVKTKSVNEVGIIGQMYEDRKTKRVGVLESREEKYKTLMMRDTENKSFNITYSTFKSNWRKYNGDEVVQTSTQVEEEKAKTDKRKKDNKKVIEEKQKSVTMTTEEKVKKLRAVDETISDRIKEVGLDAKTTKTSKGGIVVRFKKFSLFEAWVRFNTDNYIFVVREDLVACDRTAFNSVIEQSEYEYKETWNLKHRCVVSADKFDDTLNKLLTLAKVYVDSKATETEVKKPKSKTKSKKKEEEN